MAGWNNHSYLFTEQTPRLTFNGCSLCSISKCPGEFDFHYCVETFTQLFCFSLLVYMKMLDSSEMMRQHQGLVIVIFV